MLVSAENRYREKLLNRILVMSKEDFGSVGQTISVISLLSEENTIAMRIQSHTE